MRWSFRFGRVFGIDLKVHVTFFLILLLGAMQGAQYGLGGMVLGVVTMLLLFACVVLHELGHSVVAIRFGVPVREIILLPIGGVAMLSRSPSKPVHELLIAIAGPLVNVIILAVLVPLLFVLTGGWQGVVDVAHRVQSAAAGRGAAGVGALRQVLYYLVIANIMLILFNLIPAFPLDGGRVLRALLWMRMPMARATRVAAGIGQAFAVVGGIFALLHGDLILAFIAFFIFIGAGAETAATQAHTVLATRRVGDAYNKFALTLSLEDRVSRVIEYILTSYQPDFAVLQRGRLLGVVTREDVLRWLSANNYDVFVTEVMSEDVLRVDARLTLEEVVQRLQEAGRRVAAVYDGEAYLGLVSREDIAEAQLVLNFLQRGPGSGAATTRGIRPPPPKTTEPVV
jgi:Zn-dependent protease/predicted transcriptional regulator